jgi:hypothetical protein
MGFLHAAVHAIVNSVDAGRRGLNVVWTTHEQVQHRIGRAVQASNTSPRIIQEHAVFGHALRNARLSNVEQQGAAPR